MAALSRLSAWGAPWRAGLIFLMVSSAAGQEPETPVFRAGAADVRLDVQVRVGNRTISGLGKADFEILDEGVRRDIAYFGRESEPLTLLLLLDASGSTRRLIEQMAATASDALRGLGPEDRVGLAVYSRRMEVLEPFAADREQTAVRMRQALRDSKTGGGTETYAALLAASKLFTRESSRRRAVLVVTDNQGLNYQIPARTVVEALSGVDAVLNAIVVGKGVTGKMGPNTDFVPTDVFEIAAETGGEAVRAESQQVLREMVERIRTRYALSYPLPDGVSGYRRLEVRLSADAARRYKGAQVLVRKGYWVR